MAPPPAPTDWIRVVRDGRYVLVDPRSRDERELGPTDYATRLPSPDRRLCLLQRFEGPQQEHHYVLGPGPEVLDLTPHHALHLVAFCWVSPARLVAVTTTAGLFVYDFTGAMTAAPRRVPTAGGARPHGARDGRTVVYSRDGSAYRVDLEEGAERRVCAGSAWAVDANGGRVVVSRGGGLHLVDGVGASEPITPVPAGPCAPRGDGRALSPRFSRGGELLATVSSGEHACVAAWSPDTRCWRARTDGPNDVFGDVDGSGRVIFERGGHVSMIAPDGSEPVDLGPGRDPRWWWAEPAPKARRHGGAPSSTERETPEAGDEPVSDAQKADATGHAEGDRGAAFEAADQRADDADDAEDAPSAVRWSLASEERARRRRHTPRAARRPPQGDRRAMGEQQLAAALADVRAIQNGRATLEQQADRVMARDEELVRDASARIDAATASLAAAPTEALEALLDSPSTASDAAAALIARGGSRTARRLHRDFPNARGAVLAYVLSERPRWGPDVVEAAARDAPPRSLPGLIGEIEGELAWLGPRLLELLRGPGDVERAWMWTELFRRLPDEAATLARRPGDMDPAAAAAYARWAAEHGDRRDLPVLERALRGLWAKPQLRDALYDRVAELAPARLYEVCGEELRANHDEHGWRAKSEELAWRAMVWLGAQPTADAQRLLLEGVHRLGDPRRAMLIVASHASTRAAAQGGPPLEPAGEAPRGEGAAYRCAARVLAADDGAERAILDWVRAPRRDEPVALPVLVALAHPDRRFARRAAALLADAGASWVVGAAAHCVPETLGPSERDLVALLRAYPDEAAAAIEAELSSLPRPASPYATKPRRRPLLGALFLLGEPHSSNALRQAGQGDRGWLQRLPSQLTGHEAPAD